LNNNYFILTHTHTQKNIRLYFVLLTIQRTFRTRIYTEVPPRIELNPAPLVCIAYVFRDLTVKWDT